MWRLTLTCELDLENWINYSNLSGLECLYLEDSYVIDIKKDKSAIEFQMEFVLTESHPLFQAPKPDEQYCYKKGFLFFKNVSDFKEFCRSNARNVDVTGEVDFGNVDTFVKLENRYVLIGEWGKLDIISDPPVVKYT